MQKSKVEWSSRTYKIFGVRPSETALDEDLGGLTSFVNDLEPLSIGVRVGDEVEGHDVCLANVGHHWRAGAEPELPVWRQFRDA